MLNMKTYRCAILPFFFVTAAPAVAQPPAFAPVRSILSDQCFDCHNSETSEGGLNLERFDSMESALNERAIWKRVFDVVEAGQMPLSTARSIIVWLGREGVVPFGQEVVEF